MVLIYTIANDDQLNQFKFLVSVIKDLTITGLVIKDALVYIYLYITPFYVYGYLTDLVSYCVTEDGYDRDTWAPVKNCKI